MLVKAKITLTVAIVLCTTFSAASATTKHHRTVHARSPIYNTGPNNVSVSTQFLPSDSPLSDKTGRLVTKRPLAA